LGREQGTFVDGIFRVFRKESLQRLNSENKLFSDSKEEAANTVQCKRCN
jgi:hypothetical protein